nr:VP2 [Rotavirus A]
MAYRKGAARGQRRKENNDDFMKDGETDDKKDKTLREKVLDKKEEIVKDVDDSQTEIKEVVSEIKNSNNESSKQLIEILKVKEEHQKEVQYEILQKTIPTFIPTEQILSKLEDIKPQAAKKSDKLFRLFEPKQLPIYRQDGEKALMNRWYWKLKHDDLPDGDYRVRAFFVKLYDTVLQHMPDYMILKDMAVENKNSRDAGKVVDAETAKICDDIFQDEETEGIVRRFIAEMRQRVNANRNEVQYPSILHNIDYEFNRYFLDHQIIEPLTNQMVFNYIPERLRNDVNYIFNMDRNLPSTARHIPPILIQDRLNLHDNFESIYDTITTANYILARSFVPDLKELESTEAQIQKMSQALNLEALTIQSETQFITGVNSQAANECFKKLIAAMLSQRTMAISFVTTNYMSLFSSMWLMTVIPSSMFIRESLCAVQLAIVNTILYPAYGMNRMHYQNGDHRTPFEIAEQQMQHFPITNWLHFVNNNTFRPVVVDGVLNQALNDNIRSGQVINQLMEAMNAISRQNFPTMPLDYKRSLQRGILLISNRIGQIVDTTRLLCYNYETLMACLTMNMNNVQTLTTEKLQMTEVTSLLMLMGNSTVIPEPRSLFKYYNINVNFHNNYNERLNDAVAIIAASARLNLYQEKTKEIVRNFFKRLHIFDVERIPDDQMYRVRDRMRQLPVEQRRLDIFQIILNNMELIEQASDKLAQGVVIAYREMQLEHDAMYGFVNIIRDLNGYQVINIEELMRSGDYQQITNMLLNNMPVALVGAIPFETDPSAISLIAKIDATVFAQIVKERKIDKLRPILYKINSESPDFYLVKNFNWVPTSSTKVYKQVHQEFDFRNSMHILSSNLTVTIFDDLLAFISADTVEPINAVAFDGVRIMNEL